MSKRIDFWRHFAFVQVGALDSLATYTKCRRQGIRWHWRKTYLNYSYYACSRPALVTFVLANRLSIPNNISIALINKAYVRNILYCFSKDQALVPH